MKIRSLLFFLTFSFCAFAQKMPSDYFMEAIQYGQSGQDQKALENFLYIVENHPRNELYPKALYNIGFIYFQQKEYEKSIFYCWKLMTGGFNDTEELGGDIMAESYTNYSHLACVRISECYKNLGKYDSALHYLALSEHTYRYQSTCGNAYADYNVRTALRYADIYEHLNQPDSAIAKLLPQAFDNGFTDHSEVVAELKKLLAGRKKLLPKLDAALDSIYSKTITYEDHNGQERSYNRFYIKFLGTEFELPHGSFGHGYEWDKPEESIARLKEDKFYKMIAEL